MAVSLDLERSAPRVERRRVKVADFERFALILAFLGLVVVFSVLRPDSFATSDNFTALVGSQSVLVVVALGLLVPLRCGDFDLSVAGTLALSAMSVAVLNGQQQIPLLIAVLLALAIGAAVGLLNAFFVLYFGINSFIVTLGIGQILVGVVTLISGGSNISGISATLPKLVVLTQPFGIPLDFLYAVLVCVFVWFVLERMAVGRRMLFVGANRDVAKLSGVRNGRVRAGAFVAAGVLAALAGVLVVGTQGGATQANNYAPDLLQAYAAVYLGATALTPGRFNAWGTLLAAYFLITGITGLQMLGAAPYVQDLFYGGALVIAIAISQLLRGRRDLQLN